MNPPDITIRPFTEDDFPDILAVMQAATPDMPLSVEAMRHTWHTNRNTDQKLGWLVATDSSNQIVGSGFYFGQAKETTGDQFSTFMIFCYVYPHLQGQEIGTTILQQLLVVLKPYHPLRLRTDTSGDQPQTLRFLHKRGFVEIAREHISVIDLAAFDKTQFASDLARVAEQSITIKSVAELADDANRDAKLYALAKAISEDVPLTDEYPRTAWYFEQWQQGTWQNPHLHPDLWLIALDGGRYLGECSLQSTDDSEALEVGLTGVLPGDRRRGIATAIKVEALHKAKLQGYTKATTASNINNHDMININLHLGFVRQPDFIEFEKICH